jgi:hypothetical protein
MRDRLLIFAIALLLACCAYLGYQTGHLMKVVEDQRIYQDAGCKGWYQGAE